MTKNLISACNIKGYETNNWINKQTNRQTKELRKQLTEGKTEGLKDGRTRGTAEDGSIGQSKPKKKTHQGDQFSTVTLTEFFLNPLRCIVINVTLSSELTEISC